MSRCSVLIDVAADRERTFAYLADASNQCQWRRDVTTSELTEGSRGAEGAVYQQTIRGRGAKFRITAVVLNLSISWVCAEDTTWPVWGTYVLTDLGESGTRITMEVEMKPTGPWILIRPFVPLLVKATRRTYAAGLQAALA